MTSFLSPGFQSLDDLSSFSTMDSIGFSRALPKEASGNDLSWAYAMKNDLLGKKNLVLMWAVASIFQN